MGELTKDDVKAAVREALAEKFEVTFGFDCTDSKEREAVRDDMAFLRALRLTARHGGEKIFFWIIGIAGTGAVVWIWPELKKFLPK